MSTTTYGVPQLSELKSLHHGTVCLKQYVQSDHIRIVDSYHSTGGYDDGSYLIQWDRESEKHYESRKAISAYDNIYQPEVDYKVMPVFSKPIERTVSGAAKKRVEAFIDNVDLQGTSMSEYLSEKMINTELNTSTFFIVTAPTDKPINNADLTKLPYIINIDPLNCSGYYFSGKGQLAILVWLKSYDNESEVYHFQVWEKSPDGGGDYYVIRCKNEGAEEGIGVNEVCGVPYRVPSFPVRMVKLGIKKEAFEAPPPKYRGTTKQLVQVYNLRNWTVSGFGDTNFSPLLMNTLDGTLPTELALGNENIIGYPKDLDAPTRMKVHVDHLEFQEEYCDKRELSIKKQMDSYTQIMGSSSEKARIEASRKIILYWANVGNTSNNLENWIYDVALRNYILKGYEVLVKYPLDYASLTPDVIMDQIQRISETFELNQATERALFETLIKEVFGQDKEKAQSIVDAYDQGNNGFDDNDDDNDNNDDENSGNDDE